MSRRQNDLFPHLPDGKKYVSDIPELVAEWHPTKNGDLIPRHITSMARRRVWWKCKDCGHEWRAFVYMRKRGLSLCVCNKGKK